MAFWRNPEFVRHLRGQLRAPRAWTALTVMLVVCVLVGLSSWSSHSDNRQEFFSTLYVTLVVIQYGVVGLWCASACGQAIARERELKTFDSLRTTRLSWTELVVGMILGRPVLAYFVVGCSMPISGLAGLLAGYPLGAILGTYVLLVLFALFVGLVGLWGSMLSEKASSAMATTGARRITVRSLPRSVGRGPNRTRARSPHGQDPQGLRDPADSANP